MNLNMRSLAVCGLLGLLPALAQADNWPQWRGPDNNGISKEKGLPIKWSDTQNVAWKLTLPGKGSSTPAIWGERMFLTAVEDKTIILCCISTDGKLQWKSPIAKTKRGDTRGDEGNDASASPSTDGKHVYAYCGTGDFACFDFDGKEVWKFNAQERYGKFSIQHGMHITPLLHENRLYMALLTNGGHWVIALDKATGKEAWKVERESDAVSESREAYTSPVLWRNGKELQLVILGCDYCTGHRLSDGAELWRLGDLNPGGGNKNNHRIITSPLATADELIVPTCRGLTIVALKQGATGMIKAGSPHEAWRNLKGAPDVPCPLVHDGLLYLMRENGVLICLDVHSGKEHYSERLHDKRFRASPVYADGKIYVVGRDSQKFYVVKAGPKFERLATNPMPDVFTASVAISQGRLYLRGWETLFAIQEGTK